MEIPYFFSCDWGTTSFRLRQVNSDSGQVLAERREPSGVRALFSACPPGDAAGRERLFADFLRGQLCLLCSPAAALDGAVVIISGMASSSVGWRELPYAQAPVDLAGARIGHELFSLSINDQSCVRLLLISGVRTENDIMRGEETEILGLFADSRYPRIAEDGIVILPGTHSKHVRLRVRQLTTFRTYLTGELFDVLSAHSLLRASVQSAEGVPADPWSEPACQEAFVAGVQSASTIGLAGSLFQTRARTVLHSISPAVNRWFLSGLLIGAEVADLSAENCDLPILLAAAGPLSDAYRLALETLGFTPRLTVVPPEDMAVASVRGQRTLLRRARSQTATA